MRLWTLFSRKRIFFTALLISIESSDVEGMFYCSDVEGMLYCSDVEGMLYCSDVEGMLYCSDVEGMLYWPVSPRATQQTVIKSLSANSDFTQVESTIRARDDFVWASV